MMGYFKFYVLERKADRIGAKKRLLPGRNLDKATSGALSANGKYLAVGFLGGQCRELNVTHKRLIYEGDIRIR